MNNIIYVINHILDTKDTAIVAIDGPCASGKTTLAHTLSSHFDTTVIHMDDFFLQPHQRTAERLNLPGGNSDRERLIKEVIEPLFKGKDFCYRPFVCKNMSLGEEIRVTNNSKLTIIEGSYSCHPDLYDFYDLHIFCDIDKDNQYERLKERNPHNINDFMQKWIPMEEKYFEFFDIKNKCEIVYGGR